MARRYRRLSRAKKFILIWSALGLVSLLYYISDGSLETLEQQADDALGLAYYAFWILGSAFITFLFLKRKQNKKESRDNTFKSKPWNYDRKIIEISGKVEKVFSESLDRKFEIYYRDLIRKLTGDKDPLGRHPHLRFLLSSPDLKKGEYLLVSNNQSLEKIKLSKGQKVRVRGEYIHNRAKRRTKFGVKFTFYGLIHYTHKPKGWIKIL